MRIGRRRPSGARLQLSSYQGNQLPPDARPRQSSMAPVVTLVHLGATDQQTWVSKMERRSGPQCIGAQTNDSSRGAYWAPQGAGIERVPLKAAVRPWRDVHETFTVASVIAGDDVGWRSAAGTFQRGTDRLMVVPPGELHVDLGIPAARGSLALVQIPFPLVQRAARSSGVALAPHLVTREVRDPDVVRRFTDVHTAWRDGETATALARLLESCVADLAHLCGQRFAVQQPASPLDGNMGRAMRFMAEHLGEPLTLALVASVAKLSRSRFVNLFHRAVGAPPFTYLTHLRVARARTLLAAGHPCGQVAHDVGFCDQSHLNRWFTRLCGMTPGEYQKQRLAHDESGGNRVQSRATREVQGDAE